MTLTIGPPRAGRRRPAGVGKVIYGMNGLSVRPGTELAAIAVPHH